MTILKGSVYVTQGPVQLFCKKVIASSPQSTDGALNFSFGLVSFHVIEELRGKPRNSLPGEVRDERKGLRRELRAYTLGFNYTCEQQNETKTVCCILDPKFWREI